MSLTRPPIRDDRGREIGAVPPRGLWLGRRRGRGYRICDACGYDLGHLPRSVGVYTLCPECGAAWDMRASSPEMARLIAYVRRNRRIAALATRHCPCCREDLSGVRAAPDGCTVCPECGAAWWMGERAENGGGREG